MTFPLQSKSQTTQNIGGGAASEQPKFLIADATPSVQAPISPTRAINQKLQLGDIQGDFGAYLEPRTQNGKTVKGYIWAFEGTLKSKPVTISGWVAYNKPLEFKTLTQDASFVAVRKAINTGQNQQSSKPKNWAQKGLDYTGGVFNRLGNISNAGANALKGSVWPGTNVALPIVSHGGEAWGMFNGMVGSVPDLLRQGRKDAVGIVKIVQGKEKLNLGDAAWGAYTGAGKLGRDGVIFGADIVTRVAMPGKWHEQVMSGLNSAAEDSFGTYENELKKRGVNVDSTSYKVPSDGVELAGNVVIVGKVHGKIKAARGKFSKLAAVQRSLDERVAATAKSHEVSIKEAYEWLMENDAAFVADHLKLSPENNALMKKISVGKSSSYQHKIIEFFKGVQRGTFDPKYAEDTISKSFNSKSFNSQVDMAEHYRQITEFAPDIIAKRLKLSPENKALYVKLSGRPSAFNEFHKRQVLKFFEHFAHKNFNPKYAKTAVDILSHEPYKTVEEAYNFAKSIDLDVAADRLNLSDHNRHLLKQQCEDYSYRLRPKAIEFFDGVQKGLYDPKHAYDTIHKASRNGWDIDTTYHDLYYLKLYQKLGLSPHNVNTSQVMKFFEHFAHKNFNPKYAKTAVYILSHEPYKTVEEAYNFAKSIDPDVAADRLNLSQQNRHLLKQQCERYSYRVHPKAIEFFDGVQKGLYDPEYAYHTIKQAFQNGWDIDRVYHDVYFSQFNQKLGLSPSDAALVSNVASGLEPNMLKRLQAFVTWVHKNSSIQDKIAPTMDILQNVKYGDKTRNLKILFDTNEKFYGIVPFKRKNK